MYYTNEIKFKLANAIQTGSIVSEIARPRDWKRTL